MQPLEGVKVLDLSRALAGPICTMILGDLGADVIKIEPPGLGDDSREWPPLSNGESTYFASCNRNKRSIVLDLKSEAGRAVLCKMVENADVVLENYRHGVMDRLGVGYESLKAINPMLVYCQITGFGRTGPMAEMPATDVYMQAFAGLMSVTGERDGAPVKVGTSVADLTAGYFAAMGVLAAVHVRDRLGQGQLVDTSLLEGQVALLSYLFTAYGATGKTPGRLGSDHPSIVPYQGFKTRDGWVTLAAFNDRLWGRAMTAMNLSRLTGDPRFRTNALRLENRDILVPILRDAFLERDSADWVAAMDLNDVPLAPVNTIDQVMAHPQVRHREMIQEIDHPVAGPLAIPGFPVKFSETPCAYRLHPPTLGEHSEEILREFGFSDAAIADLLAASVVAKGN
ncbi:MAG: CoA transferase [Proteobacteria bacterium]|nr:CoA transferase [Pseudomonadota bacterium]